MGGTKLSKTKELVFVIDTVSITEAFTSYALLHQYFS
jgi:hypothetical protein